jgi:hypothetical protein
MTGSEEPSRESVRAPFDFFPETLEERWSSLMNKRSLSSLQVVATDGWFFFFFSVASLGQVVDCERCSGKEMRMVDFSVGLSSCPVWLCKALRMTANNTFLRRRLRSPVLSHRGATDMPWNLVVYRFRPCTRLRKCYCCGGFAAAS